MENEQKVKANENECGNSAYRENRTTTNSDSLLPWDNRLGKDGKPS